MPHPLFEKINRSLSGNRGGVILLDPSHGPALAEASAVEDLWQTAWYTTVPSPAGMDAEIERRLGLYAAGDMLPFTVLDAQGVPCGMTTFMNLELDVPRLEIGYTWLGRRVQRTRVNTQVKLLLLTEAFEQLGCVAVEFRTALANQQSQTAIERLGANKDGVLRNHRWYANGTLRDTVVYSILDREWPGVRTKLESALAA